MKRTIGKEVRRSGELLAIDTGKLSRIVYASRDQSGDSPQIDRALEIYMGSGSGSGSGSGGNGSRELQAFDAVNVESLAGERQIAAPGISAGAGMRSISESPG